MDKEDKIIRNRRKGKRKLDNMEVKYIGLVHAAKSLLALCYSGSKNLLDGASSEEAFLEQFM